MARTSAKQKLQDLKIDYKAYPVPAQFHRSDAPTRVLLGPVGCYDADTEFLSPAGWKRIADWNGEDVTQWHPDTKESSVVTPSAYINEPCGSMWRFSNTHSVDMVLSDEHRMALYDWKGAFCVKTAAAVAAKPSRHTLPTTFTPAGMPGVPLTDAQIRVMAMVHADGYIDRYGACQVQVYKDRKAARVVRLLDGAGIEYHTDTRTREDRNNANVRTFRFHPPHTTKDFASWWGATAQQLAVVVDEIQYWDGLFEGPDRRYYTTNPADADFIQYAVHACGGRASIKVDDYATRDDRDTSGWKPVYTVHIALGNMKANVMLRGDTVAIERVPTTDGRKYCFTVPTGFLVMRRNGRVFVSGNSGKSSSAWIELFRRACEAHSDESGVRSTNMVAVRDTYAQLKETTLKDFMSWFGKIATVVMDSPIRANVSIPLPDGTRLDWNVKFIALDGGERSLAALRGMQLTAAYVNEAYTVAEETFSVIRSRLGRYRPVDKDPVWSGIVADSNYGYHGCYLHSMYKERPEGWEFYEQPPAATYDINRNEWVLNPHADNLDHLPGGLDYYRKMLPGMSEPLKKQFLGNQWASRVLGKSVFPEFSPQTHIIRGALNLDRNLPLLIGMDFGLHAAAAIGQLSPLGRLVLFSEVWDDDVDLETFLDRMLVPKLRNEFHGLRTVVCGDPAGLGRSGLDKRSAFTVLASRGFQAYPAITNSFVRRKAAVSHFLNRHDGFGVHHSCERIVSGFEGGYGYKQNADGTFATEPEKNEMSHVADGVQYLALYALFGNKKDTEPYKHAAEVNARRRTNGGKGPKRYKFA